METIILIKPEEKYAKQVMDYKEEMLNNKDSLDGCAGLENVENYTQWADFENRLQALYKENYVPSHVYLAVRKEDDRVVGIIDFRHPIKGFLLEVGGNVGYSVRPSERRKGYAGEMLKQILIICKEYELDKVLVTCDKENIASRKTILKNGGILENEVIDNSGICKS